jgi:hypothetical protein
MGDGVNAVEDNIVQVKFDAGLAGLAVFLQRPGSGSGKEVVKGGFHGSGRGVIGNSYTSLICLNERPFGICRFLAL